MKWEYLNAQGQPKIEWPPSFPLVKAYTDQLERKGCVSASRISAIRSSIATAERASGAARGAELSRLATDVESERGCDSKKVDLLKKALQSLQAQVM